MKRRYGQFKEQVPNKFKIINDKHPAARMYSRRLLRIIPVFTSHGSAKYIHLRFTEVPPIAVSNYKTRAADLTTEQLEAIAGEAKR